MSDKLTFYLASHNNFGNRGCEALVRSTVGALHAAFGSANVLVPTLDESRDHAQWPESEQFGVQFVEAPTMPRFLGKWGMACKKVSWIKALPHPKVAFPPAFEADLRRADAVLSIGGDNYSLDYGLANLHFHMKISESAMRLGKPTVLWGASIGPFTDEPLIERAVAKHLQRLELITVRESESVKYLRSIGVSDNVLQVVDSAFALKPSPVDVSTWWPAYPGSGVIGLNIGSLVNDLFRKSGCANGLIPEVTEFARTLFKRTDYSLLLISHVSPLNGDTRRNDTTFNQELMDALGGPTPRLAEASSGLNAAQIKHVISKCRFLIAARTHATIAGFSAAVPTLSIAYSVKAKGINRDLFGDERYVLDSSLLSCDTLWKGFELLLRDESPIRMHYAAVLPQWNERAYSGAYKLAELIKNA